MSDPFAPPQSGDARELTLGAIAEHQERTTRSVAAVTQTLALVPRVIFMIATLLSASLAASATPLLRCRMGLLACLIYGSFGVLTAAGLTLGVADRAYGGWADTALFLLFCSVAGQFGYACIRLYHPGRGAHLHRWSGGEPWPVLARLYALVSRRFAVGGHAVAIVAEPVLLLLIAVVMLAIQPGEMREDVLVPGVWVWPAAAAGGCLAHALAVRTREAWRIQVLLDHEHDQAGLAENLRHRSLASAMREAEGYAAIDGPPLAAGLRPLLRRPVGEIVAAGAGRLVHRLTRMKGARR